LDASFGLYETKVNLDASYVALTELDVSFGLYETEANLDTSLSNVYIEIDRIDASLGLGDVTKAYVDASIVAAVDAVDTSLVIYTVSAVDAVDTSLTNYTSNSVLSAISSLTTYTVNAVDAVDTSLVGYTYSQAYIDASLDAKAEGITKDYVDGSIVIAVDAVDTSLVTYTDATFVELAGDTMTGNLILDASLQFGDSDTGIYKKPDDILSLMAGGTEMIRLDSSSFKSTNKVIVSPGVVGASTGLYFGDGDSGFYENTDDNIYVKIGGSSWRFTSSYMGQGSGHASFRQNAATSTIPNIIPITTDTDTGIGRAG